MLEPERVMGFATEGQARFGVRDRLCKERDFKGSVNRRWITYTVTNTCLELPALLHLSSEEMEIQYSSS